jgi:hypothetical protein
MLGWKGVQDFQNSRMNDGGSPEFQLDDYFNFVEDPSQKGTRFKESVKQAFEHLRSRPKATQFFLDVLELVEDRLLRMDPANRASCGEIVEAFRDFDRACSLDARYCTEPVYSKPRRASTDLSQLMATTSTFSREIKIMPSSEHESRFKEVRNSELTEQIGRSIHEARRVPRTRKLRTTSDFGTQEIPNDANEVDEGIDTIMEQDAQTSSPRKVHFQDSGIDMNDDAQRDYFPTQDEQGMSNENSRKLKEEQDISEHGFAVQDNRSAQSFGTSSMQDLSMQLRLVHTMEAKEQQAIEPMHAQTDPDKDENILVNNPTADLVNPKSATHSSPIPRTAFMLDYSGHHKISELASTNLRPSEPREMYPPDSPPNPVAEAIDEASRPLLGRYPAFEHSRPIKWYIQILCCY